MIHFKAKYKKQMDIFCEENCKATAEDIIRMAKEKSHTAKKNVIPINKKRKKKKVWKALIPAACFLLIGTTTLATPQKYGELIEDVAVAATGKFVELFRTIFKDETTAEIVEEGYLYEVNQTQTEDIFQIDLVAVTGDAANPVLVFDVYVNDEELAKKNDRIHMLAYTLGVEQYENELDFYGPNEAYGVKDEEIENLYHVSMNGTPAWMTTGAPVVVDICQINFDIDQELWMTYEVNMEYRFTPPSDIYHPVSYNYYDDSNIKFSHGGIDYYLIYGEFGPYKSSFIFRYNFVGTSLAGGETDYYKLEEKLHANWLELVDTITLVVDGKEYKVDEREKGYTWCDTSGEILGENDCNVCPDFPSINYENATSVVIKAGGESFILK